MADKYQREIELSDGTLLSLVEEKGRLVEKGRGLAQEMEDIQKNMDALQGQMEKVTAQMNVISDHVNEVKTKIINRARKAAGTLLSDYEIPVTTEVREGKLYLLVTDTLAEFKETFVQFDKWTQPVPRKTHTPATAPKKTAKTSKAKNKNKK